ncbi:MAG TPA: DedA family protein [Nocardioidaceae bacterium]|nr:DedA family protein [Nocardioidaceae bacterium]
MFDWLLNLLHGAWWSYPLILGLCGFDVVFPVLPSETAAITGGIVAAEGGLLLTLVIACAAVGAFAGDNLAYWIGNRGQSFARRWIMRGEKGRRRLEWTERMLQRHGGSLVIVGRFIPGGRTATTVGCGVLDYPRRRFIGFDAVGALTWGAVNTLVGYLGGQAFGDNTLLAFAVSFGVALASAGIIELVRWLLRRRARAQPAP